MPERELLTVDTPELITTGTRLPGGKGDHLDLKAVRTLHRLTLFFRFARTSGAEKVNIEVTTVNPFRPSKPFKIDTSA